MVHGLAGGEHAPDGRPPLGRSRSHTTPSTREVPPDIPRPSTPVSPPRPTAGRSQSFISPTQQAPRAAQTLPTESTTAKHSHRIPGLPHREHKHHHLRHRHTQSEAKNTSTRKESTEPLPHLIGQLKKDEAAQKHKATLSRNSTNTTTSTWQSHVSNIVRIASTDPYRNYGAGDAFGAANYRPYDASGPSTRQATTRTQTWIELALDRADAKKQLERSNPRPGDVERKQAELASAEDELRDRLADVGRQSGEIGRRLEYTYYGLLEKVGSLVGTIHSFQSLSAQSGQLIRNFESESGKVDADITKRVGRFKSGFEEREERVKDMEERSVKAGLKAKELQTRLQNVRTMVENWERREEAAARKRFRVWGGVFWGSVVLLMLIVSVVVYKEWWFGGHPVMAGLGEGPTSLDTKPENHSLAMNVPEEVRSVLEGVEERRVNKRKFARLPERVEVVNERVERRRDKQLRVLDEL